MTSPHGQGPWQQHDQSFGYQQGYGGQSAPGAQPGYAPQHAGYSGPPAPAYGPGPKEASTGAGLLWVVAGAGFVASLLVGGAGAFLRLPSWGVGQGLSSLSSAFLLLATTAAGIALGSMLRRSMGAGSVILWGAVIAAVALGVHVALGFVFDPASMTIAEFSRTGVYKVIAWALVDLGVVMLAFGLWARRR
ncbi:MAG: hypothetical protein GX596_10420 [Propionibacterium sp.]|nr:hypothetical protein [Propionibacterium sp.]